MRFADWVQEQRDEGADNVLKRIERDKGVGYTTLQRVQRGDRLKRYDIAKKISDATGGAVSIEEICEPVASAEPDPDHFADEDTQSRAARKAGSAA